VYPSITKALDRLGTIGRCRECPPDRVAILTSEAFGEYLSSLPVMDGDDTEATEVKARKDFKVGLSVLTREGVVVTQNVVINDKPAAWLWRGDRKVKK
jgi:hypothetical protein